MEQVPAAGGREGFNSPEEELAYLRSRVRAKEAELDVPANSFEQDRVAKREIKEYSYKKPNEVLHNTYIVPEHEATGVALGLQEEAHDAQIDELLALAVSRGIRNALSVAGKLGAHIEDDFHRLLVQYVAEGLPLQGMKAKGEVWRALHMTLYEVALPGARTETTESQTLEKLITAMEQFYSGLLGITAGENNQKNVFSIEIAQAQGDEEVIFYVAVPRSKRELFERHLLSVFSDAKLAERRDDYNIFNTGGASVGAYASLANHHSFPIKTYSAFERDPMNVVLSAFSKLKKHGEGAAIQIVIGDAGDSYNKKYKGMIDSLRKGTSLKEAITKADSPIRTFVNAVVTTFDAPKTDAPEKPSDPPDQTVLDQISTKMASKVVPTNIRIVASAADESRAADIADTIASTFNQFEEAQGNHFTFAPPSRRALNTLLHEFSYRVFNSAHTLPLSFEELSTLYHLTAVAVDSSRELKKSAAKNAPAPIGMPEAGITLGVNNFGGSETSIRFAPQDRMRHFYSIGQTGTGKSSLMKSMIIQDIQNGEGVCYIDPHGSDIIDVLAAIPHERTGDVIYFDPSYTARPMGLNMLEFDPKYPEQKTFVVNEIFSIFEKLFGDVPEALGPMFQQYFRNATMLILEGMESGTATMADIPRVLANTAFRNEMLARSQNPVVNQFWNEVAGKAGGDASLENIVPYITSKTDIFLANDIIRPIIAQGESSFNFREIMDGRKIFLVNLSKGRLGDLNSNLLGLIVVGKILQAALSRVDVSEGQRAPFYLYIDEFQNFTTPAISTILSEARKYALSLNVAHQFIAQLDEGIRDAIFGNVGTKCVFRVGTEDAAFLEKEFAPEFTAADLTGIENYNAYMALLVNGVPAKPFSIRTLPLDSVDYTRIDALKEAAYLTYGREREAVEAQIRATYK